MLRDEGVSDERRTAGIKLETTYIQWSVTPDGPGSTSKRGHRRTLDPARGGFKRAS